MKKVVLVDMLINFLLGTLFVVTPKPILRLLFAENLLIKPPIIAVVGLALFLFACWQLYLLKNEKIKEGVLRILGYFAVIPAVLLTFSLIYYFGSVSLVGRYLLFAGCGYMYVLGVYYFLSVL